MDNDKLKKIKFKRMLKRYESALEDLEYLQEMSSEINSDFNSALASKKRGDLLDNKDLGKMAEDAEDEKPEKPDLDSNFKKLFRKIVVRCHPDKLSDDLPLLERAKIIDLYDTAVKAYDSDNWAMLITVAIKLEVDLGDEYFDHIDKIEKDAVEIDEKIMQIQSSVAWTWYHSPEGARDKILDSYISHLEEVLFGKKIKTYKILGVGHPRTGTGYTAKLLNTWGLDVGHESFKEDGIVAWQLAVKKGPWVFIKDNIEAEYEHKIYCVRNPRESLPSIVYTENTIDHSYKYRISKCAKALIGNPLENAIKLLLAWDEKIINDIKPDIIYRIEHDSEILYNNLKERGLVLNEYTDINTKINQRVHNSFEKMMEEFPSIDQNIINAINVYCEKYGYDRLF